MKDTQEASKTVGGKVSKKERKKGKKVSKKLCKKVSKKESIIDMQGSKQECR